MRAIEAGNVNTTWKYGTGNSSASRAASHSLAAAPWHFGQCRLRQLLYEIWVCAHFAEFPIPAHCPGSRLARVREKTPPRLDGVKFGRRRHKIADVPPDRSCHDSEILQARDFGRRSPQAKMRWDR